MVSACGAMRSRIAQLSAIADAPELPSEALVELFITRHRAEVRKTQWCGNAGPRTHRCRAGHGSTSYRLDEATFRAKGIQLAVEVSRLPAPA